MTLSITAFSLMTLKYHSTKHLLGAATLTIMSLTLRIMTLRHHSKKLLIEPNTHPNDI